MFQTVPNDCDEDQCRPEASGLSKFRFAVGPQFRRVKDPSLQCADLLHVSGVAQFLRGLRKKLDVKGRRAEGEKIFIDRSIEF